MLHMIPKNRIMEWEGNKYHHYILSISIRGKRMENNLIRRNLKSQIN